VLEFDGERLFIQQYISSRHQLRSDTGELNLEIDSDLPWGGTMNLKILNAPSKPITLALRQPSWTSSVQLTLNGEVIHRVKQVPPDTLMPQKATWHEIIREWQPGDHIRLDFELPVRILHAHRKVRPVRDKGALARGPLVYCLESIDNPGVDLYNAQFDPASLKAEPSELFEGTVLITGVDTRGEELTFIPYHLWGNRGTSKMCVFVSVMN
jgi:hypothetical protein